MGTEAPREALGSIGAIKGQNSFRFCGRSARLAGKSDLMALKDDKAVTIEVKTVRERWSGCPGEDLFPHC